jgi:hypothetical protein
VVRKAHAQQELEVRKAQDRQEKEERRLNAAATAMQTAIRVGFTKHWLNTLKKATIWGQARWRGRLARRLYREMKIEVISLRSWFLYD